MKNCYLITGASSGIGYQISADLLAQGDLVVGVSRSASDKVRQLKSDYPDTFFFQEKDLSVEIDSLSKWVVQLSKEFGKFSGFVHSAGIQQILPLKVNTHKHMLEVFNLNLFAGLALAKGITDKRVKVENSASVVFISSVASVMGSPGIINYSASKASINGAMRSMAIELAPLGVRVNSVLPGFIETEMISRWSDVYTREYIDKAHGKCPLGIGGVDDISNMVLFLLSDKAKWITGAEFKVDGGYSLGDVQ